MIVYSKSIQTHLHTFFGLYIGFEFVPNHLEKAGFLLDKFQKIIAALEEKGVQIIQKDVRIVEKADILTLEGSLKIQLQGGVWQALSISDTAKEQETAQN